MFLFIIIIIIIFSLQSKQPITPNGSCTTVTQPYRQRYCHALLPTTINANRSKIEQKATTHNLGQTHNPNTHPQHNPQQKHNPNNHPQPQ
jgi:hypothetical protein